MQHYRAYGLRIRSNRPMPGLPPATAASVDVEVDFAEGCAPEVDEHAAGTTASVGSGSVRGCEGGGRVLRFASHGGECVWSMRVSGDGRSIEVCWRGPIEVADIAAFVEAAGLSTALALQGVPLLHGCAVDAGGVAFLVLGPAGAGKSTLAAAAVAGGRALLTDDIAALEPTPTEIRVHPGTRQLRMNEDTARLLEWSAGRLSRVFATPALPPKLFASLSVDEGSLCARALRVAAIFVLVDRRPGPVTIERLDPVASLPLLVRNTYADRAVDSPVRARLLPFWTQLAREVPIHAVASPDALALAPSVVDALVAATAAVDA